MTDKLLNCPFCGGEAETEWHHGYWGVRCQSCYVEVTADGMNDAIEVWNTRKPMDRIVEQLERRAYETADWMCGGTMKVVELTDAIAVVKGVQNE